MKHCKMCLAVLPAFEICHEVIEEKVKFWSTLLGCLDSFIALLEKDLFTYEAHWQLLVSWC